MAGRLGARGDTRPETGRPDAGLVGTGDWAYRPHIDGLRAVAVYLVVAFHAGLTRWRGGFVGVDVFFVLSGYLVTNLLVRDVAATGRVSFGRFYSRRVRRLLPAAAVNLVVVAIIFGAIAAPVDLAAGRDSIRAASLYVSNWYFIREAANYFGTDIASSPVAQYWSLSVEEQFYVLWPLVIYGLFRVTRRLPRWRMGTVRAVVAAGGVASLVAALAIARYNPNRAYYGTDTRAYQLLAGAFLALTPEIFERARRSDRVRQLSPVAAVALLAALIAVSTSSVHVGPITRGFVVTVVVFGLIIALEASTGGLGRRLLSVGPLVYLGRISYGTYLWHWIVILVATQQLSMAPVSTFAVTIPVATGLAALSFELIEHPIRVSQMLGRYRVPVIAAGLAMSVLVGVVIAPTVLRHDAPGSTVARASAATVGGTPNHARWGRAFFDSAKVSGTACDPNHIDACRVVRGHGLKVLAAGESHMQMLVPMITALAKRYDLEVTVAPLPYCPWTRGVEYSMILGTNCSAIQASLFDELIPKVNPDIVVLAHRTVDDPLNSMSLHDARGGLDTPAARTKALRSSITTVVHRLRREGRKVVLIEPIPVSSNAGNPETCLSKAKFLEQCRFVTHLGPTPEEQIYRELAATDRGVVSVDFDHVVCPYLPICDPVVDGLVVRRDDTHLTKTFAATLLGPFTRVLVQHGVLRP